MAKVTPTRRSRASAQRFQPPDEDAETSGSTGDPIPENALGDKGGQAGEGPQPIDEDRDPVEA